MSSLNPFKELKRLEHSFAIRVQAINDKNKGLENELENTTRRYTRKVEALQSTSRLQKDKMGKVEKDLRHQKGENEKLRLRIDKMKSKIEVKLQKIKEQETKLKSDLTDATASNEEKDKQIHELKHLIISNSRKMDLNGPCNSYECTICASELFDDHSPISLRCGHVFGKDCILDWLKKKNKCPACNQVAEANHIRNLYIC